MSSKPSVLILSRHAPYQGSLARSALDFALAAAAFELPLSLLFLGDGVLQLLPDQQPTRPGERNHGKVLSSLPLYEVERVYAESESLALYGLSPGQLLLPVDPVSGASLHRLYCQHDHVVSL